jgi:hypothetical protein
MGSNVKTADKNSLDRLRKWQDPQEAADIAREQEVIRRLNANAKAGKGSDVKSAEKVSAWSAEKKAEQAKQLDDANNAYKINYYIKKNPNSELAKAVQPYIPISNADDMNNSTAAYTIAIGAYTDPEVENDVETFYLNKVGKDRTWWEKIKYATRAVIGQKQHEENIQKGIAEGLGNAGVNKVDNMIKGTDKDTSIYNNAFQDLDINMAMHKDDSLEGTVLSNAGKVIKKIPEDIAEWWWITFCRPFAKVPMWADILMILGGVGLGAYSIYQGMQFVAIPSLIIAGIGGFCLYAYYYIKALEPTKDPDTGGPNDSTNHQDSKHD